MNETNIIIYNTARSKASVSLLVKDSTVGKMRLSLFDRCLIGNLKLLESRYKVTSIKGFSTINLLDACLICKNPIPKKELNK
jgi:hypothetical protein